MASGSNVFAQSVDSQEDAIRAAEQALVLALEDDTSFAAVGTGSSIVGIFKVLLTLVLAAAAVYGVVFFIKRASRRSGASDPFLKILASVSLGVNRSAHVVSVGSQAWLVGSSEGSVNLISEIEDKDILNAMLLDDSRKGAETAGGRFPDFTVMLRRLGMQVKSGASGVENIRKHRERLKGL